MRVEPPAEEDRKHPSCYNRPPRLDGRMHYSVDQRTGEVVGVWLSNAWFTDRCAAHDGVGIGPNNENYPTAHGFDCRGCRWNPTENKS